MGSDLVHLHLADGAATANKTSAPGSNKTHLLTGGCIARHCSGLTQVLVVTTSVRMIDGVHADTLHLGEDLLESGILVEQQTSL